MRAEEDDNAWMDLGLQAGQVFTPTSPIDERSLFAGRDEQVRLVVDVVNQKGQHAILYGERGVGKTSLANVLSSFLGVPGSTIVAPRVNCDSTDSFGSVWRKIFDQIQLNRSVQLAGFGRQPEATTFSAGEILGSASTPDDVRRGLTLLSQASLPILIVDEFDRLEEAPRRAFADTIKMLSDHAVGATILLVGVADSVEQLIQGHQSVERALVQIRMPRMSEGEIIRIIRLGLKRLGMSITSVAEQRIAKLSQGLPHYTHLLGLYASRAAVDNRTKQIDADIVRTAMARAIAGAQQSIRSAYDFAVRSPRKENLFSAVLLACALAETNELGYFAAQDVREPVRRITGKKYEIPSFAQHLNEFCDEKRGPVLVKDGTRRRFRYRFINPLLQPFVVMRGVESSQIAADIFDSAG